MKTTRFLLEREYTQYADWLKSQDQEAKNLFFGYAITNEAIDELVKKFVASPEDHYFLVVEERNRWVGSLHIAVVGEEVEFGLMVSKEHRGKGIADMMMEEALLWARNRGYTDLFMHCLTYNKPIKNLCHKHGLKTTNMYGESETKVKLPPPTLDSISKEVAQRQKQMWRLALKTTFPAIEIYG